MKVTRHVLVVLCAAITVNAGSAWAGLNGGFRSWRKVSADEQFVLVMVSTAPLEKDADPDQLKENELREIRDLRATYSESGLYRHDGSTEPLWTIPYHPKSYEYFIARDGRQVVVASDDWHPSHGGHVVTFYAEGQHLATYGFNDLMPLTILPPQQSWSEFEPYDLTYAVSSNQGHHFVFDITTGQVIRQRSSRWPLIGVTLFGLCLSGVFLLVVWLRRRRVPRTLPQAEPDR